MATYRMIAAVEPFQTELEVKRSRFLCTVARAESEAAARTVIERIRAEHWQANHHCSAWRIGEGGRLQRSSDDGEPSGTAGVPMLEVLNRRDVTDVVAVVTRYFGGTLLGTGGLIRAYGQAVSQTLDAVGIVERRALAVVAVRLSHAEAGRLDNALHTTVFARGPVAYGERVTFELYLAPEQQAPFAAWLAETTAGRAHAETTAGRAHAEVIGERFVEVPVADG